MFSKAFVIILLIILFYIFNVLSASPASVISEKTGLPLPRFVSLKGNKVNLRRGPSLDYKIDWIYKRKHLPLMIVSEFGHWRKVTDFEGYTGWIYKDLLSGSRYIIVNKEKTLLRNKAGFDSLGKAILKRKVIGKLIDCKGLWCFIRVKNMRGYVLAEHIWGTTLSNRY
tara:strand:+ start:182 stop:688 length:507 start_codon:yes stop_codon:yes gene_type:complete